MPLPPRCPPTLAPLFATFLLGGSEKPVVRPQSGAEFMFNVIPTRLTAVQGVAVLESRVLLRRARCRRVGGLHPAPRTECRPPPLLAPPCYLPCTRSPSSFSAATAATRASAAPSPS